MEIESDPAPVETKDRTVRCDVCGSSLSDAAELATHMEGHAEKAAEGVPLPIGPPRHKCSLCESSFETAEQLKAHLLAAHGM